MDSPHSQVSHMSAAELSAFRTRSLCFLDSMCDLLRNRALELTEEVQPVVW